MNVCHLGLDIKKSDSLTLWPLEWTWLLLPPAARRGQCRSSRTWPPCPPEDGWQVQTRNVRRSRKHTLAYLQVLVVGAGEAFQCHHEPCTLKWNRSKGKSALLNRQTDDAMRDESFCLLGQKRDQLCSGSAPSCLHSSSGAWDCCLCYNTHTPPPNKRKSKLGQGDDLHTPRHCHLDR